MKRRLTQNDDSVDVISRRRWTPLGYLLIFVLSIITVLPILVAQTAYVAASEVWENEQHTYDTKYEEWIATVAAKNKRRLLEKGHAADQWPIPLLSRTIQDQYKRTVKKVPEDDFERAYWYFQFIFLPQLSQPATKVIVTDLLEQLKRIDGYQYSSSIAKVRSYEVVGGYAHYLLSRSAFRSDVDYIKNRRHVLYALHERTVALDPGFFTGYFAQYRSDMVRFLVRTYSIFTNILIDEKPCDPEIAEWWIDIDKKVNQLLIRQPNVAQYYDLDAVWTDRYREFSNVYEADNARLSRFVRHQCLMQGEVK